MTLLDLIFPKKCLECGTYGKYICDDCLTKVRQGGWRKNSYSIFKYEGVVKKAILALKYKFAYDIAEELAETSKGELKKRGFQTSGILVPIPLHNSRKNWRGFNQSEEIGTKLASMMNWKFMSDLLIKEVSTKPQVGLIGRQRHANVKEVFKLNPKYQMTTRDQVIVFDDVYTTGSTMNEAIRIMNKNGFKRVIGLTIAS